MEKREREQGREVERETLKKMSKPDPFPFYIAPKPGRFKPDPFSRVCGRLI